MSPPHSIIIKKPPKLWGVHFEKGYPFQRGASIFGEGWVHFERGWVHFERGVGPFLERGGSILRVVVSFERVVGPFLERSSILKEGE